ncbi:unnamed protein product [Meloidogyne enterolobii]|uniref:Uncharacterized protein n=1 Tax=Meloidogyne enterolobii TaxID=390850 RepID=A0ACB0YRZ1_MELEN
MFINYFTVIEKIMEDPTLAYEVIAGMQPRVRKWKAFLLILFVSTTFSAYYWILDPSLKSVNFFLYFLILIF